MGTLILLMSGGSSNWLPLIFPIIGLLLIARGIDLLVRYVKRRMAYRGPVFYDDENLGYPDVHAVEVGEGQNG